LKKFREISEKTNEVSHVVAEIAVASEQQNQGISQVNKAVEQLNGLTQKAVANAEESASSAEEMSSQSKEMLSMVASFKLNGSGHLDRVLPRGKQSKSLLMGPAYKEKKINTMSVIKPDPRIVIPFDDKDRSILKTF
jgi:methyl-accepting chemotaxis protein